MKDLLKQSITAHTNYVTKRTRSFDRLLEIAYTDIYE